jgi:putative membrane protein
MLSKIGFILWLFILLIAGYFAIMNNTSVTVNLLPGYKTVPLPLSIIILISIIAGAIPAILIAIGDWIKFKIEILRLKKQLKKCGKK